MYSLNLSVGPQQQQDANGIVGPNPVLGVKEFHVAKALLEGRQERL